MARELAPGHKPLIAGISQFEVDFVVPRLGIDLPLCVDPFLLYKSRDPELRGLHELLLSTFNFGVGLIRDRKLRQARSFFRYPEAWEIGFGYSQKKGKRGTGVGEYLTELIIETIMDSPELLQRGVLHIEEMQLFSAGIGIDRVSDITANILKGFLIDYTTKQARIWNIPLTRQVPLEHVFDPVERMWVDGYYELPISPVDKQAILLVPRRMVRTLPWINYYDFFRSDFSAFLRAKRVKARLATRKLTGEDTAADKDKPAIVAEVRKDITPVRQYVTHKEGEAKKAQPTLAYLNLETTCVESERLHKKLNAMPVGLSHATEYQHLILEILNFLFNPELIDGELEVRTVDGTERRDIIFTNDSDRSFWDYVRSEHSAIFLMFETKNVEEIETEHINQTSGYLGDRVGRLGIIVTRNNVPDARQKKIRLVYNDSHPRKIILCLTDADIGLMLEMKCKGNDPTQHIQKLYRQFRTSVQ